MIAGTSNNLIKIHDYVLSMGYKTIYPDDWDNFMHKSDIHRCDLYLSLAQIWTLRFYIIQKQDGTFVLEFDILFKDKTVNVFDKVVPELKYDSKYVIVPFAEANWEGIKFVISRNRRLIKERCVENKMVVINKDFE